MALNLQKVGLHGGNYLQASRSQYFTQNTTPVYPSDPELCISRSSRASLCIHRKTFLFHSLAISHAIGRVYKYNSYPDMAYPWALPCLSRHLHGSKWLQHYWYLTIELSSESLDLVANYFCDISIFLVILDGPGGIYIYTGCAPYLLAKSASFLRLLRTQCLMGRRRRFFGKRPSNELLPGAFVITVVHFRTDLLFETVIRTIVIVDESSLSPFGFVGSHSHIPRLCRWWAGTCPSPQ